MLQSALFFIITLLAFSISGWLFRIDKEWYDTLKKSRLTPPSIVFGIVWSILYILIALALTIVNNEIGLFNTDSLFFYALLINYLSNQAFSYLFFNKKNLRLAFLDTIIIFLSTAVLLYATIPYSTTAALMLVPYLLWTMFALYLSYTTYSKNK